VTTVQFELLKEGLQLCEAVLSMRENLQRLYPTSAPQYDVINLRLDKALLRAKDRKQQNSPLTDAKDLDLALLIDGDGKLVRILPTARTYNTGRHSATFDVQMSPHELKLNVDVSVGDDRWVPGGRGEFAIQVTRQGNLYAGTYSGDYRGYKRAGRVSGDFVPGGYTESDTSDSQPELVRRCDQLTDQVAKLLASGTGGASGLHQAIVRLHELAAEIAAEVRNETGDR
jgi:hypothetical protein